MILKYVFALSMCFLIMGCTTKATVSKKVAAQKSKTVLATWPVQPVIDLPLEQRQRNRGGSCVHVSWITCLNNQRLYALADAWFDKYRGGEGSGGLRRKADAEGLRYADTTSGDVNFVDWAIKTRRGCIVNDRPGHVRTLVGLDPASKPGAKAWVLDNNGPPSRLHEYTRSEWISMWRRQGGWAATPLYDPHPVVTHKNPRL